MAHEIAKLILERAGTFVERQEAIRTAIGLGMPLAEIEEYLDWLELIRQKSSDDPGPPPKDTPPSGPASPASD